MNVKEGVKEDLCGQVFDTPEEAFEAYKVAKEVLIRETAERFKDVLDSRVYRNLMNWEVTVD